jgi:hypothetical protein
VWGVEERTKEKASMDSSAPQRGTKWVIITKIKGKEGTRDPLSLLRGVNEGIAVDSMSSSCGRLSFAPFTSKAPLILLFSLLV